jgi:hypothetical protein
VEVLILPKAGQGKMQAEGKKTGDGRLNVEGKADIE